MIVEKTKKALEALFPQVESEEISADSPESAEQEESKQKEETPRANGVIERDYAVHGYHLDVQVDPDQLFVAVKIIDELDFFIESITGDLTFHIVPRGTIKDQQMEVVYDFSRYDFDLCRVVIRTRVPRDNPIVPTITPIFAGANWHERETHDFFGIKFDGHPHLIPLLLPEDADFHPLLKDFKA